MYQYITMPVHVRIYPPIVPLGVQDGICTCCVLCSTLGTCSHGPPVPLSGYPVDLRPPVDMLTTASRQPPRSVHPLSNTRTCVVCHCEHVYRWSSYCCTAYVALQQGQGTPKEGIIPYLGVPSTLYRGMHTPICPLGPCICTHYWVVFSPKTARPLRE